MATKENSALLLFKDNQNNVTDKGHYSNFTLNKNHQISSDAFSERPKSVVNERRKILDYVAKRIRRRTAAPTKLSDLTNDLQTKKEPFHSWNKSTKDLPSVLVKNDSGKEDKLKKRKSLSASTLSLHIEAYENSNEFNLFDDGTKESLKKNEMIKNGLTAKQVNFDSTSVIQKPFEFPRQQESGEAIPPEIAQYRASQQLFNPNLQMPQAHDQQPLPRPSAMETPHKLPPFPSGTSTRPRRPVYEVESQPLYDEMLEALNISLSDPDRAGLILQQIAVRELRPSAVPTPLRNKHNNNNRFTPYGRYTPRNRTTATSMFDLVNLQHQTPPLTPQRPVQQFSPATFSLSVDSVTPSPTSRRPVEHFSPATFSRSVDSVTRSPIPQLPTPQPSPPVILSRVYNLPDFKNLHEKPCLRLIRSDTSVVELSRPSHCVFNERSREWIIADKDRGIVFLNKDCFQILRSIPVFDEPSAAVLLNEGNALGVLDNNGIYIYDMYSFEKRLIFPQPECRGLAVTAAGDFVTVNPKLRYIFIVPQNGDTPIYFPYEPYSPYNYEGLPSTASSINVSVNRLIIVDYTIGTFNLYNFNPYTRELSIMMQQDCSKGVPLCRLTGGFMDQKGRIIVSNCKERICFLFDHDGKFLQRIPCDGGFARTQYLCVNKDFQAVVLDTLRKPHSARLYRIVADPDVLKDDFPVTMHPSSLCVQPSQQAIQPMPSSSRHALPSQQYMPTNELEPGEIEGTLADCKSLIACITIDDDDGDDDDEDISII